MNDKKAAIIPTDRESSCFFLCLVYRRGAGGSQEEATEQSETAEPEVAVEASESEEPETVDIFTDGDVEVVNEEPEEDFSQVDDSEAAEADITEEDAFSDAVGESEDTTASSGTLATGVKWELSEDGKLTFSGSGMIEKDDDQDYPWDKSKVASVTIKEGITGIGSKAFASCTNLTEIRVAADTLQTVSADVLEGCSSAGVKLYYSGNAPASVPTFEGAASVMVYYQEADQIWTEEYKAAYENVEWIACCTVSGVTVTKEHILRQTMTISSIFMMRKEICIRNTSMISWQEKRSLYREVL